jgi:hypothetical protein
MKDSCFRLLDLPDEILMINFKKLDNFAILYSLMDVNMQLDRILHDPIFTNEIVLMKQNPSIDLTSSLRDIILDWFYSHILPKIQQKIKSFGLETVSMKRVLLTADNYPNLHQLDIFIMNEDTDIHFTT